MTTGELAARLSELLVGQPEAIETILPYIQMHQAGLSPENRPLGIFLLLGPTGTGKTRTVEALAEVLHGSSKNLLKIDCGEFQMEHEVAKLIGAPPGYLGFREGHARLEQRAINAVCSDNSNISLILFDEIEKAAPSMIQLLLGILDKGVLHLGYGNAVNFNHCMIFLTSNLGARSIQIANKPDFGFESMIPVTKSNNSKLTAIGMNAVRRKFSPEFVNRIDSVITYRTLDRSSHEKILNSLLLEFRALIRHRIGMHSFEVVCTPAGIDRLLDLGINVEFGARELKRAVQRNLINPIAALVAQGSIPPGSTVVLDANHAGFSILLRGYELAMTAGSAVQ